MTQLWVSRNELVEDADIAIVSRQTVLYFDSVAGNVYISEDEGKVWDLVQGIPRGDAAQLIEHPFDNRVVSAYVAHESFQLTCQ
jgi:NADPH-dependent 2,4-dienoyl-CoA reductase/sulfur reductase-like enzyme